MDIVSIIMLLAGGMFVGGALAVTFNRIPTWSRLGPADYKKSLDQTIRVADTLQPILLVMALISTLIFGVRAEGVASILAFAAVVGYAVVLAASLIILVPLQRKIVSSADQSPQLHSMRQKWQAGHIGRTTLSAVAFALAASAVYIP